MIFARQIMDLVVDIILVPLFLAIGSILMVILKSYANKITNSILTKNEINTLSSITETKNQLITEIDNVVQAAVYSMMNTAQEIKEQRGGKLSTDDVTMIQNGAKDIIYNSLPKSLTDETGAMSKVIGGPKALDSLVGGFIEKNVVSQKEKLSVIKASSNK